MGPPNPRREAYRILRRVEGAGAFASVLLEKTVASWTDPRDAALVTELVLGVLRRRAALDHAIARAAGRGAGEIDAPVLTAVRMGAYSLLFLDRVPDFAAVDTAVALVKEAGFARAAAFANGVLRRIAREHEALLPRAPQRGDTEALALFRSHPLWWTRRMVERSGWDTADALLAANNEPAPSVLASWPASKGSVALAESLTGEGVATVPCRFVPEALRVVAGVPQRTRTFRDGLFWIQDEASQLVVALFGPRVGPGVLDACAAPGGKSLGLASRLPPGGFVVAADRNARRLSRLRQNVARLRAGNIVAIAADMSGRAPFRAAFDDVLVDAPCSGTGTLRRHPEIRWRLAADDLGAHALRQRLILATAADLVRPGGRLVYSVCSVEPEEGDEVVAAFLAERRDFALADPRNALGSEARVLVGADGAVRTGPSDDGMDGFYAVLMTRRSG